MSLHDSVLNQKSLDFSLRIVKLYRHLKDVRKEYVISKQVLRSGTSIGANIHEAFFGQSKADFISKMSIALKECSETQYWFKLLEMSELISQKEFNSIFADCEELGKLLSSTIKTSKSKQEKTK